MTPDADLRPSGVSTSTVSRYLWPGRLIRIWSPITERRQQRNRPEPFEIHLALAAPAIPSQAPLGTPDTPASNRRAADRLIPAAF